MTDARGWFSWLFRPTAVALVIGGVVWLLMAFVREGSGESPPLWTMDTPPGRVVVAEMSRDGNFVSVNSDRYSGGTDGDHLGSEIDIWHLQHGTARRTHLE